jgi:hypothetical protein
MKRLVALFVMILLISLACSLSPDLENTVDAVATAVAETQQAQPVESAATENIFNTGDVEVGLCFPSEMIPPMTVYLENVTTQEVTFVPTIENQPPMTIPVPEGTYVAYAWLSDFVYGGSYSQSVPCGLSVSCTDHSLIEFQVVANQTTPGVEICDWYTNAGDIPFPPGADLSLYFGSLSGNLGYPSEYIPAMTVVATNTTTQQDYFVETAQDQNTYTIENLPPGDYTVVAYPNGAEEGGGYSESVPCGLSINCNDHSLIPVNVTTGQDSSGVDPVDFYADPGSFPGNPTN